MDSDAKPLTDAQRRELCQMMYQAFVELRMLGWEGKTAQAADLVEAFHNLPLYLWRDDFSFSFLLSFLSWYQSKHPRGKHDANYVAMTNRIIGMDPG